MEEKSCPKCGFTAVGTTSIPSSPIPELLNSNAIPDPSQVQSIRFAIELVRKDLAYLDGQITHFQTILSTLQEERLGLESFIHEHEAFLTPARRIVPDMLSEIFLRYSRGSTRKRFSHIPDSFDPKQGPLVLTQICSEWRQIAISTPKLWTTIRLAIDNPKNSQRRLVNLWLERSGVCALTVAVMEVKHLSNSGNAQDLGQNEAFMNICYHSNRWRSAHFSLPASDATWNSFRFIHNNLALLRDLTIHASRGRWDYTSTLKHFSSAPNLSRLSLDYKTSPSKFEFNQRTIKFLAYDIHRQSPVPIAVCLKGIRNLPHLEESVLHCGHFDPILYPHVEEAHSFSLKRLTVIAEPLREAYMMSGIGGLFTALFLPALQSLEIISINNARDWNNWPVVTCISRSPLLQRLVIKCDVINAEQLLEVLRQTPTLTDLTIASSNSTILPVLTEMTIIDISPPLLPKLTQMEIIEVWSDVRPAPHATADAMISMVINRSLLPDTSTLCQLQYAKATLSVIQFNTVQYVREAQTATGLNIQLCGNTIIYQGTRDTGTLATSSPSNNLYMSSRHYEEYDTAGI